MDIVISIASKIAESLVTPIGREFGYLIYYDTKMKDLKDQLKKLIEMKDGVQELVNAAANRNGEVINSDVQTWVTKVDELIQKVSHFEEEVNKKRRCLYRWNMSRKATKITQDVLDLQKERTFNNNVAHPAPSPMIWSTFKEGFKDFKSRMTCVNRVIEVLKNEEVRMIGICGMGGVGKTTMVKEIIKRLAGLKVFDNVVMAVVSQSPSIWKIQSEIADELGFTYEKGYEETGRKLQLYERLMKINRILIVLDDVWTELDFEAIGLPPGLTHKGCKFLLTSRNLEECNAMGSQKIFTIPALTPEESWELFREIVGKPLDDPDLAKRVTNECAGLPLAILTVAKALENARKYEWEDALNQLKSSVWNKRVYSSIHWSYDRLESDEEKSCLLLCCLFPEDYDIPIEYLVRYGWGRGYFSNTDSVEEARNRVHSLVDKLQRRFLLLDSERKDHTKMHDIVRDVAIQIALRDPHGFLIRCDAEKKGWPKIYDHYTTISLIPINIDEIPVGLECPKLELLHLEGKCYSENSMDIMCKGMKELKVLALVDMGRISALPSSLGLLKSLRTLSLNGCHYLTDISDVIGRLENLEILSFRNCRSILELLREIGLLKHLRLLDITGCYNLQKIPHGLLSSLSSLEELYMGNSFRKWERPAAESEDKRMASLVEVMSLLSNHLKVLVIEIPDFNLFPKDFYLTIQTTIRFNISNREEKGWFLRLPSTERTKDGCYAFENRLHIAKSDATEFMEIQIVQLLFKKCEDLFLYAIKNLKYVLNELDQEGLQHLKVLRIRNCPELKAICHDQLPQSSFINLRSLELRDCPVLKYAFSLSVASNLVQLQSLNVHWCPQMKEIVSKEWREDETAFVGFPKLTNLTLRGLSDEFVGFYEANKLYSNHEDQNVVGTSYDEHQSSRSFERAVFPSKCILWLQNLEEVTLEYANVDVLFDLKGHMVPAFSHLRKLEISFGAIQHLWKNIPRGFQGFQNLRYLKIEYGHDLQYVFPHSIARLLVNLEELNIRECLKMETIVRSADENEKEDQTGMTLFPKLNSFDLNGLPSLESLCPDASTSLWLVAKVMSVRSCNKLKTLASVIPQIKKLEKDSTAHHEDEDEGISSGSCGCTPYSCGPMTKPTSRTNIVQILPRPVNQDLVEVAPTNLDQDSNDNLERLSVRSCESLKVVFQLKGPEAVETHNVQAFNKLCYLSLNYLPSLMHVWETGSSQHVTGFGNLTFLSVSSCGSLGYLFLSTVAKLLVSLKDLEVRNCEKIEQVIAKADTECADQEITFPRLNSMTLEDLPNLICFSTEAYTLKLPSLMELKVIKCPDLRTFASKVVNTHSVIQVYTEWMGKSEWMGDLNSNIGNIHEKRETQRSAEVTTPKDENVVGTSYDEHQSSRSFERAVFPSKCILWLWLQNLEEVKLEYANGIVDVLFDLKGHMVPAFSHLRKLEILLESPCQHLWKNIPRGFQGFQNLSYLKIGGDDLQYVFPHSIARLLVNLEELNITECRKMETIVKSADENEKEDQTGMTLFPKLNSSVLYKLPSLENLCPDASTSVWSAAKVMFVERCDKLKTLVAPTNLDQDSNDYDNLERLSVYSCESLEVVFQLKGPKAVESHNVQAFNKLFYLWLSELPRLMHVWETGGSQHITGFGNLTFLSVSGCGSLRYLFLSTVAKLLVSLKDLKVGDCEKIEQVIAKADTECADQEITFPRLNSMTLAYLPNLICFSTEAHTLKLPSLMELKVIRCPYLRTFASKVVNTHSRIQVHTELGKSEWMGDLNSTIGNIHEKRETQRSAEFKITCEIVDVEDKFSSEEYNAEQVDEEVNTDSTE